MNSRFWNRWNLWLVTASCLTTHLFAADPATSSAAENLLKLDRPLVIGHRGYPSLAPENTLPAFHFSAVAGADLVELDYHHSKEGTPIVIHDYDVDRTTNGDDLWQAKKVRVETKSAEELRKLDAGAWYNPPYAGLKLPLLTEAIATIQSNSVTLIERKAGDAATCVKLLQQSNLINQVVVQAFDWNYLKDFHKLEPKQILGALGPSSTYEGRKLTDEEKVLNRYWVDEVKKTGAQLVVWSRKITKESVDYAHAQGLKVWVYTINDVPTAQQLLDLDIDGIITDNTSLIWRAMALRSASKK